MLSQYTTQKLLKTHFQEVINTIGKCNSIKSEYPDYYLEFLEVFKRHPNYPDKFMDIIDIKIDYFQIYRIQLVVYIIKTNGEIDDVSVLNSCITGKPKNNLKIAMRVAIQPQIDEYRNTQTNKLCELCNITENIEIDHHSELQPFEKLYNDYMTKNTLEIPFDFDNNSLHLKCFNENGKEFSEEWIKFHKDNAILRMLCKKCNGKQQKYKIKK
jgi:hypothetical protein